MACTETRVIKIYRIPGSTSRIGYYEGDSIEIITKDSTYFIK